ncbi:MAG: chorismate-binding protein [Thermaerobacter sp.]|nr:chorismate-binding protein [Thermaerobacter sp.]
MAVTQLEELALHRRRRLTDLSPIAIYQCVAGRPGAFLLESAPTRETVGRYSYIGWEPIWRLQARGGSIRLEHAGRTARFTGEPWQELRRLHARTACPAPGPDAPPFYAGAVGYLGYDLARRLERLGAQPSDDRGLPEMYFVVPRVLIAYDHVTRQIDLIVAREPHESPSEAEVRLDQTERMLARPARAPRPAPAAAPELLSRTLSPEAYARAVLRAKEAIAQGEIFQAVIAQRHDYRTSAAPLDVYRALRALDPSPYLFHLRGPSFQFYGSSPETLVRVRSDRVTVRPIAGTRGRPQDPARTAAVALELQADPKERAEHLMLLDLGRNDVGRVATPGSVEVLRQFAVEEYARVIHLVSEVEGKLAPGKDSIDALAAAFPAGTLTGAPKIRAMQLIDELEPVARGPYGGALGYLGADGDLDFAIAIRSIVQRGDIAYLQAGAGIVADSSPEREEEECQHKLASLRRALELAGSGAA